MNNQTTTPQPGPTPTPPPTPKTRRPRNTINRAHLDEIAHSRSVATAAVDPANTASLIAAEFDATLPAQINTLAGKVETDIGKLTGKRVAKNELTVQETNARDVLIALIGPIQTAAKRKFTGDQETLRHSYFIGENLAHETLEEVHTAAAAIRDRIAIIAPALVPVDVLPGIKAAQIAALGNALGNYTTQNSTQNQQQFQNSNALIAIETELASLAILRHAVQLTADQAWPWRTPGVSATRAQFLLPTDRPLGA